MERLEDLVGRVLDNRYQLHAVVGAGGSAVVFRAEDMLLRRTVAIKMLRSEAVPEEGGAASSAARAPSHRDRASRDEEARVINRAAFRREAIAATVLSHPGIVTVYDVSPETENPYIVMEYADGIPLSDRIARRGALSITEILFVARGVLEALCEAHERGVVHRDIKAQNILLTRDGTVKVTDFGIAQLPGRDKRILKNKVLGSVDTISPEQAGDRHTDARSDIYSLGVVLYQMATGELPFVSDDPNTVAFLHISEPPKYPSTINPAIPRGLEQIILTAMEKQPDKRFSDAASMLSAVTRLEEDSQYIFHRFVTRRRTSLSRMAQHTPTLPLFLGILAAVLCGALLFAFLWRGGLPSVTVVRVPACLSQRYEDLRAEWGALDPRVEVRIRYVYREDLPEGTVIAQEPAADTLWKLDGDDDTACLTLTVSTQDPDYRSD